MNRRVIIIKDPIDCRIAHVLRGRELLTHLPARRIIMLHLHCRAGFLPCLERAGCALLLMHPSFHCRVQSPVFDSFLKLWLALRTKEPCPAQLVAASDIPVGRPAWEAGMLLVAGNLADSLVGSPAPEAGSAWAPVSPVGQLLRDQCLCPSWQ